MSEDPLLWNGGGSNFYSYVANNPVIRYDPSGRNIAVIGDIPSYAGARAYSGAAPGMALILQSLSTSNSLVQINTNNDCRNNFDPATLTINWDPTCIAYCDKGHCWATPALLLGHELTHAFHYLNDKHGYDSRASTVVPDYDNAEEQLTIAGTENNAAIVLRECLRLSHHGRHGRSLSPTSID